MRRRKHEQTGGLPATRSDLHQWIHGRLKLAAPEEKALCDAVDAVLLQHERLWQQSKDEALHAVSQSLTRRMGRLRDELNARDATVRSITRYFEDLVADLTDRLHRDPKTGLATFPWFIERLESFLRLEQQEGWCTVGLVDIRSFKTLNDTLGHSAGDLIIERVALLLREHVRAGDVIAQSPASAGELHARFGGDEFCFLISDLDDYPQASIIADRFRRAVECHDWSEVEPQLAGRTVTVDVGVVCVKLGPVYGRRQTARQLARDLVARADALMYQAKAARAEQIEPRLLRIENGQILDAA
jgi:diguanylate cyclase (GGDEF)-like protein